jgi:YHS domain-containing protein
MKLMMTMVCSLVLSGALLFAAEPKKEAPKKPATQPTTQPTKPVNKNCAVMQDHEADVKVTHVYNGKTYAFCCSECITEFKKTPEKFKNAK